MTLANEVDAIITFDDRKSNESGRDVAARLGVSVRQLGDILNKRKYLAPDIARRRAELEGMLQ